MALLLELHVAENDIGHRSRHAVQICQANGKEPAVVDLRNILDPIVADVLVGAALEGDASDDPVLALLEIIYRNPYWIPASPCSPSA